eukprot:3686579-Pleurochrysis_carterae.AAC.7
MRRNQAKRGKSYTVFKLSNEKGLKSTDFGTQHAKRRQAGLKGEVGGARPRHLANDEGRRVGFPTLCSLIYLPIYSYFIPFPSISRVIPLFSADTRTIAT